MYIPCHVGLLVFIVVKTTTVHAFELSDQYRKIDLFLAANVDSEDLEINIGRVEEWLDARSGRACGLGSCMSSELDRSMKNLIRLRVESLGPRKCSIATHMLLVEGKRSAGFPFSWYLDPKDDCRIARLVKRIANDLARECTPRCRESFKSRLATLDQTKLNALNSNFDRITQQLESATVGLAPFYRSRYLMNMYFKVDPCFDNDYAKHSLTIAKSQSAELQKLDNFVNDYFLLPCKYYLDTMRDILKPMAEYIYLYRYEDDMHEFNHFYKAVGRYNWCRRISRNKKFLVKRMEKLYHER